MKKNKIALRLIFQKPTGLAGTVENARTLDVKASTPAEKNWTAGGWTKRPLAVTATSKQVIRKGTPPPGHTNERRIRAELDLKDQLSDIKTVFIEPKLPKQQLPSKAQLPAQPFILRATCPARSLMSDMVGPV